MTVRIHVRISYNNLIAMYILSSLHLALSPRLFL